LQTASTTAPARFSLSRSQYDLFTASHQEVIVIVYLTFRQIILYFVN